MKIDALVEDVVLFDANRGKLKLAGKERGISALFFKSPFPLDVGLLKGKHVWADGGFLMRGETRMARFVASTGIEFCVVHLLDVLAREEDRQAGFGERRKSP